ncbi:MAG: methyl-accepting chemotaxis protein [Rivihabitans pingtungensis]
MLFVPGHEFRPRIGLLPFMPPLPDGNFRRGDDGRPRDGHGGPPGFERGDKFRGGPGLPLPWVHVLAGILASLAFSAGLAWYVAKPIGHLRQAFRAVSAGKLNTRVRARMGRRRDEFSDLAQDFDSMTGQLEALITRNAGYCMIFPTNCAHRWRVCKPPSAWCGKIRNNWIATLDRLEAGGHPAG